LPHELDLLRLGQGFATLRGQYFVRKLARFTSSRGVFDWKDLGMHFHPPALGLAIGAVIGLMLDANTGPIMAMSEPASATAQTAAPAAGMGDADKAMTAEQRMQRRFPQPVRVGDLIGLAVLDDDHRTLGFVRDVVRTPQNKIELIVGYNGWCGWCNWDARPVAVPVEVVGIRGREIASLDMPRSEYAAAPNWQRADATVLSSDDSIRIALAKS
jgi:hypothetical protein